MCRGLLRIAPLLLLGGLPGCISGIIYTHIYEPLSTNYDRTPVYVGKDETGTGAIRHITLPIGRAGNVDIAAWSTNAIGDIAKREGIEEICYADIETLSVLFRIWNQYTVHVYGRPAKPPP